MNIKAFAQPIKGPKYFAGYLRGHPEVEIYKRKLEKKCALNQEKKVRIKLAIDQEKRKI